MNTEKERLTPDNPVLRGTAQNPDVYFQGRETVNKFYDAAPEIVQNAMDEFAKLLDANINYLIITVRLMQKSCNYDGLRCRTAIETVEYYMSERMEEKVGLVKLDYTDLFLLNIY
jgi:pyruvate-ferredoxin/flavodoxin oxidoreductase